MSTFVETVSGLGNPARASVMTSDSPASHFSKEVLRELAPEFQKLADISASIGSDVVAIDRKITEQGLDVQDIRRQFIAFHQHSMAHSEALESQIAALRSEMNFNSARTNLLLEKISDLLSPPASGFREPFNGAS
jgi:hypothetical protein